MRIGVLTTSYPHDTDPVAGSFVRAMVRSLVARGHAVHVVCAARVRGIPVADPGVTVEPAHAPFATPLLGPGGIPDALATLGPVGWPAAASTLLALARTAARAFRDVDALLSHFVLPCAPVLGRLRNERAHLAIAHGTDAAWLARLPTLAQRRVLDDCTSLRFVSTAARDRCHGIDRVDARVWCAPMPVSPIDPSLRASRSRIREMFGIAPEEAVLLSVGRLVRVKGIDRLAGVSARVPRSTRLVIVGAGPARARIEAPIRAAWGSRVHFTGVLAPHERDRWLAAADLFVAPARELEDGRRDAVPAAVLEALGAGLPVLTTSASDAGEWLGDAGRVAPDDDVSFADAVGRALEDTAWRTSARHVATGIATTFDPGADTDRVERALRALPV